MSPRGAPPAKSVAALSLASGLLRSNRSGDQPAKQEHDRERAEKRSGKRGGDNHPVSTGEPRALGLPRFSAYGRVVHLATPIVRSFGLCDSRTRISPAGKPVSGLRVPPPLAKAVTMAAPPPDNCTLGLASPIAAAGSSSCFDLRRLTPHDARVPSSTWTSLAPAACLAPVRGRALKVPRGSAPRHGRLGLHRNRRETGPGTPAG